MNGAAEKEQWKLQGLGPGPAHTRRNEIDGALHAARAELDDASDQITAAGRRYRELARRDSERHALTQFQASQEASRVKRDTDGQKRRRGALSLLGKRGS